MFRARNQCGLGGNMARRRLSLAEASSIPCDTAPRPPIARVTGESAAEAALAELSGEIESARAGGRFVSDLPTDAIMADYLVRDRVWIDEGEMAALRDSIAQNGQRTPIEVVSLDDGRYGLISGWRRLTALRSLYAETAEARFATVKALLQRPEGAEAAYRAMVDENELRVGLSHWERARIATKAAEIGLYSDARAAITGLFPTASKAKRSKIASFLVVYAELDGALAHPAELGERLGLTVARALESDPTLGSRLRAELARTASEDAGTESALLVRVLARTAIQSRTREETQALSGWRLSRRGRRLVIEGAGVDAELEADLTAWLTARAKR